MSIKLHLVVAASVIAVVALAVPAQAGEASSPRPVTASANRPVVRLATRTKRQPAPPEVLPPVVAPDSVALPEAPRPLPEAALWDLKPIGAVTLNIKAPEGELPEDSAAPYFAAAGEYADLPNLEAVGWSYAYYWQASAFCHGPLYFEEVNLERYGYTCGLLQPAVSGAHFFGTLPLLPYKMAVDRPGSCIYTLGLARPGSYTPFRIHRPPLRWDAALVEGAAVTGLIFLIP